MTRTNFVFTGWYRDSGFISVYNFNTAVSADITLHAEWFDPEMVSLPGITDFTGTDTDDDSHVFRSSRTVTLSPFEIAKYETTYELWYKVYRWACANGYTFANPGREGSAGTGGAAPTADKTHPVTSVNWRDAIVWCNAYSQMNGKEPVYYTDTGYGTVLKVSTNDTGTATLADTAVMKPGANGFRLPTEAEWEYAARGGDPSDITNWSYTYAGSNTVGDVAWYQPNAGGTTHPVGEKTPNGAGLYDMSGNAGELCWDWKGSIGTGTVTNPTGPASGTARIFRSGQWGEPEASLATYAHAPTYTPGFQSDRGGFRVVRGEL
jgi:uncharacterized repeat protein (TIGR02543 family)